MELGVPRQDRKVRTEKINKKEIVRTGQVCRYVEVWVYIDVKYRINSLAR